MANISPSQKVENTDTKGWNPAVRKRRPRKDDSDVPPVQIDFSHPVYKKLSHMNGDVNKLNLQGLRKRIEQHRLNPRGNTHILKKRLKSYYKNRFLERQDLKLISNCEFDYFLVIDFEATCEDGQQDFPHEIIEFPVVVISVAEKKIVDQYHSYVKPVFRPLLTPFCKNLTGITQAKVDQSPEFPVVLTEMWKWVCDHNYHQRMAILTDGPWDMSRFMYLQCCRSKIDFPKWAKKWVNIRKVFTNFYDTPRYNLAQMLQAIGETFQGHPHAGIDDSKNIARIAIRLIEDGAKLDINELLYQNKREVINREEQARNRLENAAQQHQSCNGAVAAGGGAEDLQAGGVESQSDEDCELEIDMDNLNLG